MAGTENGAFQKLQEFLIVVILHIDGFAAEGHALTAHIQPDEDRVTNGRNLFTFPCPEGRVEVQSLGGARHLIARVEIQQDAMRAAARILCHAKTVEGDAYAAIFELGITSHITSMSDGQHPTFGRSWCQVAENVCSMDPRGRCYS